MCHRPNIQRGPSGITFVLKLEEIADLATHLPATKANFQGNKPGGFDRMIISIIVDV